MKNPISPPPQKEGKQLDCHEPLEFPSLSESQAFYLIARKRLLDINCWHEISESPSAKFCIIDADLGRRDRQAQEGDFIRIDIPGPGLPSADGYDWVQIERIEESESATKREICLTLRPCADPTNNSSDIAHFFKNLATSTLLIQQNYNKVNIHYAGRNELVNLENESISDNIRNFFVGVFAKVGASYPQWKALIKGIAKTDTSSSTFIDEN